MSQSSAQIFADPLAWLANAAEVSESPLRLKGVPLTARVILSICSRIEIGAMGIMLPDGRSMVFRGKEAGPQGVIILHSYKPLIRLASGGSLGLAESYLDGEWESPDLTAVLECGTLNGRRFSEFFKVSPVKRAFDRIIHAFRPNTRAGSRRNIHAHYDLGNSFYERWLDPTMTYSSALFESPNQTLASAQTAKYRALADMMDLKPGEHVLEIGCGWGGFAEYAARERGARVTGLTISREQLAYAQARMQRQGLSEKVDLRFQDYRDVGGTFDKVASIEMFEAVGEKYWPIYFNKIHQVLKPGGAAALQVITIEDENFETYRRTVDFIQKYVFPGGMLPSKAALKAEIAKAGLSWNTHFAFAKDYARTLAEWRHSFLAAWPDIESAEFDARFKRLWTFYLAYCEAGFQGGAIDVIQLKLTKP
jgi:cyclopropane-fatty-acyl-phospholipid synthase